MTVNDFVPVSAVIGFFALVFLLTVYGIFVCRRDVEYSLLYAALTVEIMLLCYGIVKSLMSLLYPLLPAVFHSTVGIAVMLAGEAASLALAGFCYYMVYSYFSMDDFYPMDAFHPLHTTAEMRQMFLVFIGACKPALLQETAAEFPPQHGIIAAGTGGAFSEPVCGGREDPL